MRRSGRGRTGSRAPRAPRRRCGRGQERPGATRTPVRGDGAGSGTSGRCTLPILADAGDPGGGRSVRASGGCRPTTPCRPTSRPAGSSRWRRRRACRVRVVVGVGGAGPRCHAPVGAAQPTGSAGRTCRWTGPASGRRPRPGRAVPRHRGRRLGGRVPPAFADRRGPDGQAPVRAGARRGGGPGPHVRLAEWDGQRREGGREGGWGDGHRRPVRPVPHLRQRAGGDGRDGCSVPVARQNVGLAHDTASKPADDGSPPGGCPSPATFVRTTGTPPVVARSSRPAPRPCRTPPTCRPPRSGRAWSTRWPVVGRPPRTPPGPQPDGGCGAEPEGVWRTAAGAERGCRARDPHHGAVCPGQSRCGGTSGGTDERQPPPRAPDLGERLLVAARPAHRALGHARSGPTRATVEQGCVDGGGGTAEQRGRPG